MGNQLHTTSTPVTYGTHVPMLNAQLCEPFPLPTGAVFIPMSPFAGDLSIHRIPQIVLNVGMEPQTYQDCIYEINQVSIRLYSQLRNVIIKIKNNSGMLDLYTQSLEKFIINVENLCQKLNENNLKKDNLVFIPFVNILRDETNEQHFGIIIDYLNKDEINKKVKKIGKKRIKSMKKKHKKAKQSQKSDDSSSSSNSLFACFKFGNNKNSKNQECKDDNKDNNCNEDNTEVEDNNSNNHGDDDSYSKNEELQDYKDASPVLPQIDGLNLVASASMASLSEKEICTKSEMISIASVSHSRASAKIGHASFVSNSNINRMGGKVTNVNNINNINGINLHPSSSLSQIDEFVTSQIKFNRNNIKKDDDADNESDHDVIDEIDENDENEMTKSYTKSNGPS